MLARGLFRAVREDFRCVHGMIQYCGFPCPRAGSFGHGTIAVGPVPYRMIGPGCGGQPVMSAFYATHCPSRRMVTQKSGGKSIFH
jgi:hypothetical protein